jgi:hypothetical protein
MNIQEIAKKIADELKNPHHAYKNERKRFNAMCKKWHRSHGFLLNMTEEVFCRNIRAILEKEHASKETQRTFAAKAKRRIVDEGSGLLFTLKQITDIGLNSESYI